MDDHVTIFQKLTVEPKAASLQDDFGWHHVVPLCAACRHEKLHVGLVSCAWAFGRGKKHSSNRGFIWHLEYSQVMLVDMEFKFLLCAACASLACHCFVGSAFNIMKAAFSMVGFAVSVVITVRLC